MFNKKEKEGLCPPIFIYSIISNNLSSSLGIKSPVCKSTKNLLFSGITYT